MAKYFLIAALLCLNLFTFAQQRTITFNTSEDESSIDPVRLVTDNGLQGVDLIYEFKGIMHYPESISGIQWDKLYVPGFSSLKEVGKAALPVNNDLIVVPVGADYSLKVIEENWVDLPDMRVYPALEPATDHAGDPSPVFVYDAAFYASSEVYPANAVSIAGESQYRELTYLYLSVCPVRYVPSENRLQMLQSIHYTVEFSGASHFVSLDNHTPASLNMIGAGALNKESLSKDSEMRLKGGSRGTDKDYIIVTVDRYLEAAQRLAQWKQQLGHGVELVSQDSWTSAQVKAAIHDRYNTWMPKPDYFVILGDHQDVPGEIKTNSDGDQFATDLYYACMNSAWDYQPDMAFGRISVNSPAQAVAVVNKIINYQVNPVNDASFYSTGVHAAYFQDYDDYNSYADRRFAQTAEELRDYMINQQQMTVERVYHTDSDVTPLRWNFGSYSAGEPLPAYLKKPTFPWDGDAADIVSHLNSGALYIMHRDHGDVNGWSDPSFKLANINQLNNGNKLPLVLSINCLTGKYMEPECFSEKFLRHPNGGAVGVFGHAEVSYSGYNDALAMGMIDAIWSSPGFVPNFTGTGGQNFPSVNPHNPIYTLGDIKNYALTYMNQTWGISIYTHELIHLFGDPAMNLFTSLPQNIVASNDTVINAGTTTQISINANITNLLATLVVDGELVAAEYLGGTSSSLAFPVVSGNTAILTLSGTNIRPYIDTLRIVGVPEADFVESTVNSCDGAVKFTNLSVNNPTDYLWAFGDGHYSTEKNPVHVYRQNGTFSVKLTATNSFGDHVMEKAALVSINRPAPPQTVSAGACSGGDYTLQASGSGELLWYDALYGGSPVHEGSEYQTGPITQTVSFYVENVTPLVQKIGKVDDAGQGEWGNTQSGLFFNCLEDITLKSVKVYANGAGNRTFELYDDAYNLVHSKTMNIADGEHRITLDFELDAGDDYLLVAGANSALYINNGGAAYPYKIENVVEITESSYNPDPLGYYFYFYDWEVESMACKSVRVPVSATVGDPVADFTYEVIDPWVSFMSTSTGAVNYYWDLGNGSGSAGPNPCCLYPTNGTYNVELSVWNNCSADSKVKTIDIQLATGMESISEIGDFKVYPIPANEQLHIDYQGQDKAWCTLMNMQGAVLLREEIVNGTNTLSVDQLSAGIYLLHLTSGDLEYIRKIVLK